jgi:curved DNA-binding protein CbpA
MAPPRALLDAAAREMAEDAVGPAPPEVVEEVELVGAAARDAAATRVLKTVANDGDAYDVLNVSPSDSSAVVKRAFWKLSLMVHPDKCEHARAAEAFDVVKKAHTSLSDPSERSIIDGKREERSAREGFQEWLAEERKRAEWRKIQGVPEPGDDDLLNGPKIEADDGGREEWMTSLPEQRRPVPGGVAGKNVAAFNAKTFVERDARTIADWTDAPKDAATRETRLFLAAQEEKYAAPAAKAAAESAKAREHEALVDAFNEKRRPKTLLERHQEKQEAASAAGRAKAKAERKAAKKRKAEGGGGGGGGAGKDDGDGTGWEYKPWNRDVDLEAGRQSAALKPEEMLKKAGGDLKGRFGGGAGGGGRTFL